MRALIIDPEAKKAIAQVVNYASAHTIPLEIMKQIATGEVAAAGFSPNYCCNLFDGFRVVFTIEEHPSGWYRHISISVPGGKLPNVEAARFIMKEFGFTSELERCVVRQEDVDDADRPQAISILEPIIDGTIQ